MGEVVGQMFLGTAAWIDKVQKILDVEERSEEHPCAQVPVLFPLQEKHPGDRCHRCA